jgi:hypothetical protein
MPIKRYLRSKEARSAAPMLVARMSPSRYHSSARLSSAVNGSAILGPPIRAA